LNNREDGNQFSFKRNISRRIQNLIYIASLQGDVSMIAEDTLYMLDDYMIPKLKKYRDEPSEFGIELESEYKEGMHRVRTIALTLYNIEAIPSPSLDRERLKYSDMAPEINAYSSDTNSVAQTLDWKTLMMYYLDARRQLTEKIELKGISNPYNSLHHVLDIGFSLLAPYVSNKDHKDWEEACTGLEGNLGTTEEERLRLNESKNDKILIQGRVMNRERMQMSYRDIDVMGEQPEEENIFEEYRKREVG